MKIIIEGDNLAQCLKEMWKQYDQKKAMKAAIDRAIDVLKRMEPTETHDDQQSFAE